MEYHYLGSSGLEVSRIALGTIPFGTTLNENTCQRVVDIFFDSGGNFLDTSNLYGGGLRGKNSLLAGTSEKTVGKVVKGKRQYFIIATKGYWLMEDEVRSNNVGLSRTYLTTQIEASLRRLQTDYIDLYQCHAWDFYTPVEETMRVLDDFIRAGKIRYIGVSNWDGWHVVKANTYARFAGLTPLISNQVQYSLADRAVENSVIPACVDQKVSIIAWGALAQGFLSGKYRRGTNRKAADTRFKTMKESESTSWNNLAIERNWATLDALAQIAKRHGRTISNVAIRWLLQAGTCDVVITGFSQVEQFVNNLETMKFRLSDEDVQELKEVSEQPHPYPINFLELFCKRESEFYGGLR